MKIKDSDIGQGRISGSKKLAGFLALLPSRSHVGYIGSRKNESGLVLDRGGVWRVICAVSNPRQIVFAALYMKTFLAA